MSKHGVEDKKGLVKNVLFYSIHLINTDKTEFTAMLDAATRCGTECACRLNIQYVHIWSEQK